MADDVDTTHSILTVRGLIFNILRRPLEFGLIGAAVVLVLHLANRADILPKVFKGAGFELEFRQKQDQVVQTVVDTAGGVDEIKAQVAFLRKEIGLLKEDIVGLAGNSVTVNSATVVKPTESKQDIAITAQQLVDKTTVVDGIGVIWIGTYDPVERVWTDSSFSSDDFKAPEELAGTQFRLTSDVNVRAGFPENSENYFSKVKALGVANDGTQGTVLGRPQAYSRESGMQYWANVDLTYRPYIGSN